MTTRRNYSGPPRVRLENRMVGVGVAVSMGQAQRLRDYADARGTSVSKVVRGLVEAWERTEGLVAAE